MSSLLLTETAIDSYNMYRVVWEPQTKEIFVVLHKHGNDHQRYPMAAYSREEPGIAAGHLLAQNLLHIPAAP